MAEEIYMAMAAKPVETNIDQASAYIRTGNIHNPEIYSKTCLNLGSAINSAIANNAVPSSSHIPRLVLIVDEVYKCKTELLRPSLVSLMLPIKTACQIGWFLNEDKDRILEMVKEVSNGFSNLDKLNIEPVYAHDYISNIISRFYPRMKLEHILTSFDVKAGYGTFVVDFHISLGTLPHQCRDLWLLVAKMDNMDTAACIASPSNVNFRINRQEIPKRTKHDMGEGPQLPSNVTKMIKYGVNLLEVLGDFDGQYMIALAYLNFISSPDPPQLQNYVYPVSDEYDSDCEVSGVSSRVSLDCPISQRRIKTPVKGHLCKHPQCFDYNNFIEINSMLPIWKCPICNKPVCNLDIRIDQNILKILKEVANIINDVIISEDGSWVGAMTNKSQTTKPNTSQNYPIKGNDECTPNLLQPTEPIPAVSHTQVLTDTGTHNNHVPDTPQKPISRQPKNDVQDNDERTTVTTPAISPQVFRDSLLQSQGSCDPVNTPLSVQQTRHHPDPVNMTTPQSSPNLGQTTQSANVTSTFKSIVQDSYDPVHTPSSSKLVYSTATQPLSNPNHQSLQNQPNQGQTDQDTQPADVTSTFKSVVQGSCDPVHTPSSSNLVNSTATQPSSNPNHQSLQNQPNQGQTDQETQPADVTSAIKCIVQGLCDMVRTPLLVHQTSPHPDPVNPTRPAVSPTQVFGTQNNHVSDTPEIPKSIEANDEARSILLQSNVTVSPTQIFTDSLLQSQGSSDPVHTPPSVQQTGHHLNPVNMTTPQPSTNPNHPSPQSQPNQGQTNQTTQPGVVTSTIKSVVQASCDPVHPNLVNSTTTQPSTNPNHQSSQNQPHTSQTDQTTQPGDVASTTKKARTMFTPVQLTPCATTSVHYTPQAAEQLRRESEQPHYNGPSHGQTQPKVGGRKRGRPRKVPSSIGHPEPGRMKGCLQGEKHEAARLESTAPPRQYILANQPWSIPIPTAPVEVLLLQQFGTNSEKASNQSYLPQ